MKDVNKAIRKKLYELLSPLVGVPVHYKYMPASVDGDAYILITAINNNDTSTMHTSDTATSVQICIYTKDTQANDGNTADDIAQIIYDTIYPNPQAKIDLEPGFQNYGISFVNDVSPDAILTNEAIFINRFITFRFNIMHRT